MNMLVGTAPVWGPGTFTPPTVPKNLRPKSLTVISAGPAPNAASNAAYTASIAFDAVANSRSIRDENPVLYMESETLYSVKGDVPDSLAHPDDGVIGKAKVVREGVDVTIVAYSRMTHIALEAAEELRKEGISAEVVDLRSVRPLDEDTIVHSVRKTHRCVVVHEGWPYGGVGAEVSDRVQRLAFDALDAPILRVTTLDVPMPYNAKLEQFCIPQVPRVVAAAKRTLYRKN